MFSGASLLTVLALMYCYKKYNPTYLRSFPIYAIGNELTNIHNFIYRSLLEVSAHIFTLFEFFYFVYFLYNIITRKKGKQLLLAFASLFIIAYAFLFFKMNVVKGTNLFVLLESVLLSVGCTIYFLELLSSPTYVSLDREPAFWMAFGIFFYFVVLIPTLIISGYYQQFGTRDLSLAFYSVNNYCQVVSYILFYKAMTCRKPRRY